MPTHAHACTRMHAHARACTPTRLIHLTCHQLANSQELEKNAIRDKLLEVAGNDAVSLARKLAERQCLTRFGTFIPEY